MASPFPGMDPYLQDPAFWPDFHHRFLDCWCEAVADLLPEAYDARLNERVQLLKASEEVTKLLYPDVVVSRGAQPARRIEGGGGTLLLEPVTIPHEVFEEVRQVWVEILHRPDRRLVAVLEMLSPTNKTGDGFGEYCGKRRALLQQKVHLVELDLLVGGNRLLHRQPLPAGDYFAFVSRLDRRPDCQVYAWTLRQPLPIIPIPLLAPDPDVQVDLEAVFGVAYERGRYGRALAYGTTPAAPLAETDQTWARQMRPS